MTGPSNIIRFDYSEGFPGVGALQVSAPTDVIEYCADGNRFKLPEQLVEVYQPYTSIDRGDITTFQLNINAHENIPSERLRYLTKLAALGFLERVVAVTREGIIEQDDKFELADIHIDTALDKQGHKLHPVDLSIRLQLDTSASKSELIQAARSGMHSAQMSITPLDHDLRSLLGRNIHCDISDENDIRMHSTPSRQIGLVSVPSDELLINDHLLRSQNVRGLIRPFIYFAGAYALAYYKPLEQLSIKRELGEVPLDQRTFEP